MCFVLYWHLWTEKQKNGLVNCPTHCPLQCPCGFICRVSHGKVSMGICPAVIWAWASSKRSVERGWSLAPLTFHYPKARLGWLADSVISGRAIGCIYGSRRKKSNVWLSESRTTMRFGPESRLEQICTKANLSCPSTGQILSTVLHQGSLYPSLLSVIELLSLQPYKCLKDQVLDWVLEAK